MAMASTVKILLRCLRSGCNYAADILSLDWVETDLKQKMSMMIFTIKSLDKSECC